MMKIMSCFLLMLFLCSTVSSTGLDLGGSDWSVLNSTNYSNLFYFGLPAGGNSTADNISLFFMDYEESMDTPTGPPGRGRLTYCGDGRCRGGEDCGDCPEDCGACMDATTTTISTTSTTQKEIVTGIPCLSDGDCMAEERGDPYCVGNDVYQLVTWGECYSPETMKATCVTKEKTVLTVSCPTHLPCTDGDCVKPTTTTTTGTTTTTTSSTPTIILKKPEKTTIIDKIVEIIYKILDYLVFWS
jgi:hypothetical protein